MKSLELFARERNENNDFLDLYGNELPSYYLPKGENYQDLDEEVMSNSLD